MRIIAGPPEGIEIVLEHAPQVLSWDAKGTWPQERLIPYQEELRRVAGPLAEGKSGLAVSLRAGLAAADLRHGRDLDNLLDPVVRALGPKHFVAVWGLKSEGVQATVRGGPPTEIDADRLGDWYRARARVESATDFNALVARQLAGRIPLPGAGPVEVIVAFTIGPERAWLNLSKPAIDVLGGILGRSGGEWAPRDKRIVRLGLTYEVDPALRHAIVVDYWWRHAAPDLPEIDPKPRRVVGIDGYPGGWVGVLLVDGVFAGKTASPTLVGLVKTYSNAAVFGADIPIGFAPCGGRKADEEARRVVGPRASSVFPTPPRAALDAQTFEEANRIAIGLTSKGVSQQSWALRARIVEANALAAEEARIIEVHPEVSFREMRGEPLPWVKTSWNGHAERRRLLASQGITLPDSLGEPGAVVPPADVFDAAAAAWSADRMLRGVARPLPQPPEQGAARSVAIWY